jgi:hypothetical protein
LGPSPPPEALQAGDQSLAATVGGPSKLRLNWAPEQIAGWLKRAHPEDESYQVSHETIYRSLFVQARGVLKKELLCHLRSKHTIRRSKQAGLHGDGRGQIKDPVSIRQRPAAVEDRAVPGHWEGDLLSGPNNSYIATLVERHPLPRRVFPGRTSWSLTMRKLLTFLKKQNPHRGGQGSAGGWLEAGGCARCQPKDPRNSNVALKFLQARSLSTIRTLWIIALASIVFAVCSPASAQYGSCLGACGTVAFAEPSGLSADGSAAGHVTSGTTVTASLTTTRTNDIIIAMVTPNRRVFFFH